MKLFNFFQNEDHVNQGKPFAFFSMDVRKGIPKFLDSCLLTPEQARFCRVIDEKGTKTLYRLTQRKRWRRITSSPLSDWEE